MKTIHVPTGARVGDEFINKHTPVQGIAEHKYSNR